MKKTGIGLAVLVMVFSGIFSVGCEEEQATGAGSTFSTSSGQAGSPQDMKMTRLISAENRQLKKEIETDKKQMAEQKQQLDKCQKERQEWQYKAEKGLQEEVEKMSSIAMTEHQRMTAENEKLSAEIARLKGGNKPAPPPPLEKPEAEENVQPAPPPMPPPAE
jgi:TolA-binding protein